MIRRSAVLLLAAALPAAAAPAEKVRPAAKAGSWYPADPGALRKMLGKFLDAAPNAELPGEPVAVIVPHAGYAYSGATAARGFKAVGGRKVARVILLGPSHYMAGRFTGAAVPRSTHFATPLGRVAVDAAACARLAETDGFIADDRPHAPEHCLEIELPLMQMTLKGARIVPVLLGSMNADLARRIAGELTPLMDKRTLIVVSTDFTHYGPNYGYVPFKDDEDGSVRAKLAALDGMAIDRILAVDPIGFVETCADTRATICGRWAVAVALEMLSGVAGAEGVLLGYTTSGEMTKDWTNSVSYAAVALCRGAADPLTADEQTLLLRMARDRLRAHLSGKDFADPLKRYPLTPRLKTPGAAFVTLTTAGRLRGCIGHVRPRMPLYASVLANTVAAAARDPRFAGDRLAAADEPQVRIEISVLSRHRRVRGIEEIEVGRDGLIIRRGRRGGLLLPQVPVQQKWDLSAYLAGICRKAGLPDGAWKDPRTRLSRFGAQVFAEPHATTRPKPRAK